MSLGTNGASAAQLENPKAENEFVTAQAVAEEEAAGTSNVEDNKPTDGQMMAAAASDSPASA